MSRPPDQADAHVNRMCLDRASAARLPRPQMSEPAALTERLRLPCASTASCACIVDSLFIGPLGAARSGEAQARYVSRLMA